MTEHHIRSSVLSRLTGCLVAALWVIAACWARHRYLLVCEHSPLEGRQLGLPHGVLTVAISLLAVWGQSRVRDRSSNLPFDRLESRSHKHNRSHKHHRLVPSLTVGIALAGLIASSGISIADGLSALVLTVFLVASLSLRDRLQMLIAGAGLLVVMGGAWAIWAFRWLDLHQTFLDRVSYATQWRHTASLLDVVIIAVLLGALGASQIGRSAPAYLSSRQVSKALAACLVAEATLVTFLPATFGYYPITMLIPALLLCGVGWSALCELMCERSSLPIRGLALMLTLMLGLWAWVPVRALGQALLVGTF